MSDFIEFEFDDGSALALQVFAPVSDGGPPTPGAEGAAPGFGGSVPVARRRSRTATAAGSALRTMLSPLVPLLQQVRDTAATVPDRPDELSVSFGVRVGQDLKLAVVGAKGEATLSVTATWQLGREPGRPRREEDQSADDDAQ
ncbi:CU044_2847 family protein [Streptomyces sp. JJ38]|uniref:CU044_2847 family protein n=1 Tax=Streptomyces sp. JJ38 TaxID=2738128 RepID=UPI001C5A3156|nr:CU044_2847 family protein [Streptomyces sp. JJ38]